MNRTVTTEVGKIQGGTALLRALTSTAMIWAILPTIADAWCVGLAYACRWIVEVEEVRSQERTVLGRSVTVPAPIVAARSPTVVGNTLTAIGAVCVGLALVLIPGKEWGRLLPVRIGLGLVVLIQATACVCAASYRIEFDSGLYVASGLTNALVLCLMIPAACWATHDRWISGWRGQFSLTAMACAFLFVFPPLQYLSHVVLVNSASTLLIAPLQVLFGPLLHFSALIAIYGLVAGWSSDDRSIINKP